MEDVRRNERPAILVVDPLYEFVHGDIRGDDPDRTIPNVGKILEQGRSGAVPIVFCCDEHLPQDDELRIWGPHAMKGSEGARIIDELEPEAGDHVVPKRTYSGFFETGLDSLLRDLRVDSVYVTGFYDDPCVRHTVSDAYFRRYGVTVVTDAIAAMNADRHDELLEYMEAMYGARRIDTGEALAELPG